MGNILRPREKLRSTPDLGGRVDMAGAYSLGMAGRIAAGSILASHVRSG
jgi:hypothetical protein